MLALQEKIYKSLGSNKIQLKLPNSNTCKGKKEEVLVHHSELYITSFMSEQFT